MNIFLKIFRTSSRKVKVKSIDKISDFYKGFVKPGDLCFDIGANMPMLFVLNPSVIVLKSCVQNIGTIHALK